MAIPYRYRFDSKVLLDESVAICHKSALSMNWQTFTSTILGALFTFSGILFTHVLNLQRQKRADRNLIKALMQGLQDEINGLLEFAKVSSVHQIEAAPEGKPYEGLFTASLDYFTVYHVNAALVMQINDASLRRSIIQTYTRAKWLLTH